PPISTPHIYTLSLHDALPIYTLIKRLYNLSSTMLDESIEALLTRDPRLANDALHREDDADMMYWLLIRLLLSAQADDSLLEQLRSEEHTSELQSRFDLVCRLL